MVFPVQKGNTMVDDILFHTLLLVVFLWLCLTWYWMEPGNRLAPYLRQGKPAKPSKTRVQETKPFSGFTTKPLCVACEHAPGPDDAPRSAPPPRLHSPGGRPRHVATHQHFCPETTCRYYGWIGRGNIRANGHPGGGPRRQLQCVACWTYFQETHGTLFHGKHVPAEVFVHVIAALAE